MIIAKMTVLFLQKQQTKDNELIFLTEMKKASEMIT